jgi:pimeloyl-ACP methyl ester carboxylesterase
MDVRVIPLVVLAILVAVGVIYQIVGSRRDRRRYPAPGGLVDVGGYRLHARCMGEGRPVVVFEAGIAASSLSWSLVQPEVARVTRTCSYDRAGLAWSEPSRSRFSLAGLVDEMARLLRALSLEPPYVLVGHSFGTFVIRAFAAARRDEVAGMVLLDPITTEEWCNMTADERRMLRGGVFLSRIGALLAHLGVVRACLALLVGGRPGVPRRFVGIFGPTAVGVLARIVGEVQKLPAEVLPPVQALWCRPQSFRSMAAYLAALPRCAAMLAHTKEPTDVPLVVLSAANSPPARLREHARMAQSSPEGRHRIAGTGGHWINLDHPAMVIQAIRDIVDSVRIGQISRAVSG